MSKGRVDTSNHNGTVGKSYLSADISFTADVLKSILVKSRLNEDVVNDERLNYECARCNC